MAYPDERTYPGREPDPEVARLRAELAWEKREHGATALAWFAMGYALSRIGCLCGLISIGKCTTGHVWLVAWPIATSTSYWLWLVSRPRAPGTLPTPPRPPRPSKSPWSVDTPPTLKTIPQPVPSKRPG